MAAVRDEGRAVGKQRAIDEADLLQQADEEREAWARASDYLRRPDYMTEEQWQAELASFPRGMDTPSKNKKKKNKKKGDAEKVAEATELSPEGWQCVGFVPVDAVPPHLREMVAAQNGEPPMSKKAFKKELRTKADAEREREKQQKAKDKQKKRDAKKALQAGRDVVAQSKAEANKDAEKRAAAARAWLEKVRKSEEEEARVAAAEAEREKTFADLNRDANGNFLPAEQFTATLLELETEKQEKLRLVRAQQAAEAEERAAVLEVAKLAHKEEAERAALLEAATVAAHQEKLLAAAATARRAPAPPPPSPQPQWQRELLAMAASPPPAPSPSPPKSKSPTARFEQTFTVDFDKPPAPWQTPSPPKSPVSSIDEAGPSTPLAAAEEALLCVVCMENPKEMANPGCGHLCACRGCAFDLKLCPICREPADNWIRIFS